RSLAAGHWRVPQVVAVVRAIELQVEIDVGRAGRRICSGAIQRPFHHDLLDARARQALVAARADVVTALRIARALTPAAWRQRTACKAGRQRDYRETHIS